ncbi:MAG: T9SS type A sorting domain-containing protein [Candidatus Kapaibacterium sp.]
MKNNRITSRREFIKKILAATVTTVALPHYVLGKAEPEVSRKSGRILGRYHLDLNEYPVLKDPWGSVRLDVLDIEGYYQTVIVTHIPESERPQFANKEYVCVSVICPHEGAEVYDLHPELHVLICSKHGTVFEADGSYVEGPASDDLEEFQTFYEGGNDLYIEFAFYQDVPIEKQDDEPAYLTNNYPNPAASLTHFEYGISNPGRIRFDIYDSVGNHIRKLMEEIRTSGHYSIDIDVSGLQSGTYFIIMNYNNKALATRKITVLK